MSKRGRRQPAPPSLPGIIERYVSLTRARHVDLYASESGDSPIGIKDLFGSENASNEAAVTFEQRLTRCYELAFSGLMMGAPEGSFLVHGSMHGPDAPQRIGHAWLLLPGGLIWEPITALVQDRDEWYAYARAREERTYSKLQAARASVTHGDYGRWHESRYP